jgi:hypothetical protein
MRDFLPVVSSEPLAILMIRLSSVPSRGNPPNCVFENLFSYLPEDLELIDIPFDFSSSAGIVEYTSRVEQKVEEFNSGTLKR